MVTRKNTGCISFDSYIKPQLSWWCQFPWWVVYLLIPTSNHNRRQRTFWNKEVVYLLIPTSNHNYGSFVRWIASVVYLLIPTSNHNSFPVFRNIMLLYIFWFLHQTTTVVINGNNPIGCISFDSYIKPQLWGCPVNTEQVVYLLIPTSNHN